MEKFKNVILKILYPPIILVCILFPISISLMIFSMIFIGMESVLTYITYALSFYSLLILSLRAPEIIKDIRKFTKENKYIVKFTSDTHLRFKITLYGTLIWNISYAIFQLCLGIYHVSFWFYSMAIYYILLALIRYFLLNYTKKYKSGENYVFELKKYNLCGWILLLMNLAISVIIFFIIYWNRTFYHNQITTIALAAYTFFTFTFAIVNFIKYRKYNSPVYSASKSITLVAACVSMITLTTTMLTTFGGEGLEEFRQIILAFVGGVVSLFVIVLSIQIIVSSTLKLNKIKLN